MAERKKYSGLIQTVSDREEGLVCDECGCRMSFVIKTEHIGDSTCRIRRCRHCGYTFHSVESKSQKSAS